MDAVEGAIEHRGTQVPYRERRRLCKSEWLIFRYP